MGDMLTQSEIDELLLAMKSGKSLDDDEEKKNDNEYEVFDFRTANKFSKEHMKTFSIIFENFVAQASNILTAILRTQVTAKLISVEEVTFQEFSNSIPSSMMLAILETRTFKGHTILKYNAPIVYEIINRSLGGTSSFKDSSIRNQRFTEIDMVIMEKITQKLMVIFDSVWSKISNVSTTVQRMETSLQFAQIISYSEAVAVITIEIVIGENVKDFINFCIPQLAVEPIIKMLNTKSLFESGFFESNKKEERVFLKKALDDTKLDIKATFADTEATIEEIVGLRVGDVLKLNHKITEPMIIEIGDVVKFHGLIGISQKKYAVKITNSLSEEAVKDE